MTLLKEGKTNWKYILIVLILALIAGGGILGYCRWMEKEKVRLPEERIKPAKKPTFSLTETKLATIPEEYEYEILDTIFSPNGKYVAYIVWKEGKQIVVCNNQESREYDKVRNLTFSPNGENLAYIAFEGCERPYLEGTCKSFVVFNGKESRKYDVVEELTFSPDSRHFAYIAYEDCERTKQGVLIGSCKALVAFDGKESKKYDAYLGVGVGELTFSLDSQHFVYKASDGKKQFVVYDGQEGKKYDGVGWLTFSPNSQHFAYVARQGSKRFIVYDNEEGKRYEFVSNPIFSPDSQHFVYVADGSLIVIDHKESSKRYHYIYTERSEESDFFNVPSPTFSPDSQRLAFGVYTRGEGGKSKSFIVCDGQEGKHYSLVSDLIFSPDSRHYVYIAQKEDTESIKDTESIIDKESKKVSSYVEIYDEGEEFVVYDGKEGKRYKKYYVVCPSSRFGRPMGGINNRELAFSLDGQQFAYVAQGDCQFLEEGGFRRFTCKDIIVLNGEERERYDYESVSSLTFSPNSKHFAYIVANQKGSYVVIDEKEGKPYDAIYGRIRFSPESKYIAYGAKLGNELWWIVDEME